MSHIKVFIVDDNVLVRFALKQLLENEPDIIVVGDSSDHPYIEQEINFADPDILILDIPLPRDRGIFRLKEFNSQRKPIIVFTKDDNTFTRDLVPLLDAGAVGFILKPSKDEAIDSIKAELIHEIHLHVASPPPPHSSLVPLSPFRVVAVGSSTGGPEALSQIVPQFPENFPAGIAIVQHMPAGFTTHFAERLDSLSKIHVKEARNGDVLETGTALLAPGDFHMIFRETEHDHKRFVEVSLTKDPPKWGLRPSVDYMMNSLAPIYGQHIIGVILTGMGEDGVIGMRTIKQNGGQTLVQNEITSIVYGMAQQVVNNNLADEILPLDYVVPRILEILKVN